MDGWIAQNQGEPFDRNGEWAASGTSNEPLLNALLQDPYFAMPPLRVPARSIFISIGWRRT